MIEETARFLFCVQRSSFPPSLSSLTSHLLAFPARRAPRNKALLAAPGLARPASSKCGGKNFYSKIVSWQE